MNNKESQLKSGFKWSSIDSVAMLLVKVIRGLIIPILLAPAQYGLFTSVGLFTRYLQFSDFGARQYLAKNLPGIILKKSQRSKDLMLNEVLSFIFLSFILVFLYLVMIALFYEGENESFYQIAIILLIPITLFSKSSEILSTYAISHMNYRLSSSANIIRNITSFIIVVSGVYFYGAIGGIYGLIFVELIVFSYLLKKMSFKFRLILNKSVFKNIKSYLKLFAVSISETIINTYDFILIIVLLTPNELGLLSLGTTFGWPFIALSGIFITTIQPEINKYIQSDQLKVDKIFNKYFQVFLIICSALLNFIFIAVFLLIKYYYVDYEIGLNIYFLMSGTFILRSSNILIRQYIIAKNKEYSFVINSWVIIGLAVILGLLTHLLNLNLFNLIYFIFFFDIIFLIINLSLIKNISSNWIKISRFLFKTIAYLILNILLVHILFVYFDEKFLIIFLIAFLFSIYPIIELRKAYKRFIFAYD